MNLEQAIEYMRELKSKNISYEVKILGDGNSEFYICTPKEQCSRENKELLNSFIKENNLSVEEKGKQLLISSKYPF